MESHKRSIAKAMSWRVIALLITTIVAYVMTGKLDLAVEIGLLDTLIKLGVYYGHERAWLRISYGRPAPMPPPEYHI